MGEENREEIGFRPLEDSRHDFLELYDWCNQKEVYEWFEQRPLSYDEIVSKYRKKRKKQSLWIIQYGKKDIGLVQIYPYEKDELAELLSSYSSIYEYDLFIGIPSYLSKGLGKRIIPLINQKVYDHYPAKTILLRPFARNKRAIRCYEHCQFQKIGEFPSFDTLGREENIVVLIQTKKD